MVYFITGANGLIGSVLCSELLMEGHKLKALKRKNSDLTLLADCAHKIEWIEGDLSDIPCLEEALHNVEVVIHAAAMISFHPANEERMFETNVAGTANLVNAALTAGVKRFCYISSIAAIGKEKDQPISTEKTQWEESEHATNYARSKYLAELEVWRGIEEGLNGFIVNPSVVLGPGNWETGSTKLFKYVYDEHSYYTEGMLNYVDVRDVSYSIRNLIQTSISAQRFIISGGTISYQDFFDQVAKRFQKKAPHRKVTPFIGELAWRIVKIGTWLSKKEPLITKETVRLGKRPTVYDNQKIRTSLHMEFRSIQETLDWTCQQLLAKVSGTKTTSAQK